MIPKVEACIRAVEGGVARTHHRRKAAALDLLEIFTDEHRHDGDPMLLGKGG